MTFGKFYDIIIIEIKKELVIIVIKIILLVLWAITAITTFVNYEQIINVFTNGLDTYFVYIIIIIGAPFFAINNIICNLIGLFLPEGWEAGDEEFFTDKLEEVSNELYELLKSQKEKDKKDDD